ncbi:MBOAT family O-acyltransferase [Neiella holothuriorum]|nr:MBOAT family O-acyltransferase [Neiella holothuriorum]
MSLANYVKRRNGVALGAPHSMRNMLYRSFGAGSFAQFWQHWNPIWGYYLARKVARPLSAVLPTWMAVIITFAVSGALHDIAISLVKGRVVVLFSPWFVLMSLVVLASRQPTLAFHQSPWLLRASINLFIILACLAVSLWLLPLLGYGH